MLNELGYSIFQLYCVIGHWGTCAGLNLVYAHASYLITRLANRGEDVRILYVTGPGHGAPGILSTLFIEVRVGFIFFCVESTN